MVKHTQTIRQQASTNCLSMFDHFVGLVLTGLIFLINQFHVTGLFLYPLKTPEHQTYKRYAFRN